MSHTAHCISTIDTTFSDGYARETVFRSSGDMLAPSVRTARFLERVWQGLLHWRIKRAGRLALHDLTDDQLRDIGLTRVVARQEVNKSRLLML
ncbi:MAG: DUF1127 domain-containing protein [Rhizobium sp.]|nr:DUF1127 domain-containing protein [Rhizobium sp.]